MSIVNIKKSDHIFLNGIQNIKIRCLLFAQTPEDIKLQDTLFGSRSALEVQIPYSSQSNESFSVPIIRHCSVIFQRIDYTLFNIIHGGDEIKIRNATMKWFRSFSKADLVLFTSNLNQREDNTIIKLLQAKIDSLLRNFHINQDSDKVCPIQISDILKVAHVNDPSAECIMKILLNIAGDNNNSHETLQEFLDTVVCASGRFLFGTIDENQIEQSTSQHLEAVTRSIICRKYVMREIWRSIIKDPIVLNNILIPRDSPIDLHTLLFLACPKVHQQYNTKYGLATETKLHPNEAMCVMDVIMSLLTSDTLLDHPNALLYQRIFFSTPSILVRFTSAYRRTLINSIVMNLCNEDASHFFYFTEDESITRKKAVFDQFTKRVTVLDYKSILCPVNLKTPNDLAQNIYNALKEKQQIVMIFDSKSEIDKIQKYPILKAMIDLLNIGQGCAVVCICMTFEANNDLNHVPHAIISSWYWSNVAISHSIKNQQFLDVEGVLNHQPPQELSKEVLRYVTEVEQNQSRSQLDFQVIVGTKSLLMYIYHILFENSILDADSPALPDAQNQIDVMSNFRSFILLFSCIGNGSQACCHNGNIDLRELQATDLKTEPSTFVFLSTAPESKSRALSRLHLILTKLSNEFVNSDIFPESISLLELSTWYQKTSNELNEIVTLAQASSPDSVLSNTQRLQKILSQNNEVERLGILKQLKTAISDYCAENGYSYLTRSVLNTFRPDSDQISVTRALENLTRSIAIQKNKLLSIIQTINWNLSEKQDQQWINYYSEYCSVREKMPHMVVNLLNEIAVNSENENVLIVETSEFFDPHEQVNNTGINVNHYPSMLPELFDNVKSLLSKHEREDSQFVQEGCWFHSRFLQCPHIDLLAEKQFRPFNIKLNRVGENENEDDQIQRVVLFADASSLIGYDLSSISHIIFSTIPSTTEQLTKIMKTVNRLNQSKPCHTYFLGNSSYDNVHRFIQLLHPSISAKQ